MTMPCRLALHHLNLQEPPLLSLWLNPHVSGPSFLGPLSFQWYDNP